MAIISRKVKVSLGESFLLYRDTLRCLMPVSQSKSVPEEELFAPQGHAYDFYN